MFDNLLIFTLLADAYRYKWKTLEYFRGFPCVGNKHIVFLKFF